MALPEFVAPMLARIGEAFDSETHVFEPKWDGFRALAFVEASGLRVLSRRQNEFTPRYPETQVLRALPAGTLLDGELVCMRDGRVDFEAMLKREQAREGRIRQLAAELPVAYAVFDVLYEGFESRMGEPLAVRRERLRDLVAAIDDPRLVLTEGVIGEGRLFFEQSTGMGLEGMVAKDLSSVYEPGRRSGAWTKVKRGQEILCVIIGYQADDTGDLKSLAVASNQLDGTLRPVGRVGSGLGARARAELQNALDRIRRSTPLVPCDDDARWTEPALFCTVRFLDWTSSGTMREPVFVGLTSSLTDAGLSGEV